MLFLSLADLPIGYYTVLRFVVTIAAVAVVAKEYDKEINLWMIVFGLIAILFNPIIPVYLNDKRSWMVFDAIAGVSFLVKGFMINKKLHE